MQVHNHNDILPCGIRFVHFVTGPVPLKIQDVAKAQKYCKWAGSALDYDDVTTAISNLEKALRLLKTGKDDGE